MNLQDDYEDTTHRLIGAGKVLADAVRDGAPLDQQMVLRMWDQAWADRDAAYTALKLWREAQ